MKDSSVFITGATGFIGQHLVELLIEIGARITILSRRPDKVPQHWQSHIEIITGDLAEGSILLPVETEYIFHCAGVIKEEELYQSVNVDGTEKLLTLAAKLPALKRFVHLSSVGVMGCTTPGTFDESEQCTPGNGYERSKLSAENKVIQAADIPVVVLRPSIVFGVNQTVNDDYFLQLFSAIKQRRFMLIGKGENLYNLIYVEDLCAALVELALVEEYLVRGKSYILNDPVSWNVFSDVVCAELGVKKMWHLAKCLAYPISMLGTLLKAIGIPFPLTLVRYKGLTSESVFLSERLHKDVGFRCKYGTKAGLKKTISSYLKMGML